MNDDNWKPLGIVIADLVQVMHGIDAYRGRTCGACVHGWNVPGWNGSVVQKCRKGCRPYGPDDGCDWFARREPAGEPDMATARVPAAAPHKCAQRPFPGPDEAA
jgi:hypothetical protein